MKFISILLSLIMAGLFLKIVSYSYADKYKKNDEDDDNDNNGKIHIN